MQQAAPMQQFRMMIEMIASRENCISYNRHNSYCDDADVYLDANIYIRFTNREYCYLWSPVSSIRQTWCHGCIASSSHYEPFICTRHAEACFKLATDEPRRSGTGTALLNV